MEPLKRETVRFFMGRVDEWRKSGEATDGAVKEGNGVEEEWGGD